MRLLVRARVQHHPSRQHLLPALLESLSPLPTEVIEHASEPTSPWAGYQQCMENLPACSHMLIVQDDAELAANFAAGVRQIAHAQPDVPVCLFLARLPRDASARAQRAFRQNVRYVPLSVRGFLPVVAVLWPRAKLIEFRAWTQENPHLPGVGAGQPRSDDAMGGRWKMYERQRVLACVPSIVQHPDVEPSTIGRRAQMGRDRGRVAELFTDDALAYDW